MRIISGSLGGTRLHAPESKSRSIRPTSDRAKEALFSILQARIPGASVLDLYAGTGALGLEAISRGAQSAMFIDSSVKSIELIKKNCQICGLYENERVKIIRHNLHSGLPKSMGIYPSGFDVIFVDPPYSQGLALEMLHILATKNVVSAEGVIVLEERSNETLPDEVGGFSLIDHRKYGDTGFWLYVL